MTPEEIKEILLNSLFPQYSQKFGIAPSRNVYNISSLTHGAKAYLANRQRAQFKGFNHHMLRGAAIDRYVKEVMREWDSDDSHVLKWILPYVWHDSEVKDIVLIGHFDLMRDSVILEIKAPQDIERFNANGSMIRAVRQVSAYAHIAECKMGRTLQAFVVLINSELVVREITAQEQIDGWNFVKKTAYEVARVIDQ